MLRPANPPPSRKRVWLGIGVALASLLAIVIAGAIVRRIVRPTETYRDYFTEFASVFPVRVDRVLSRFGYLGPEKREASATFFGRYILTMQQETSARGRKELPVILLIEVKSIVTNQNGQVETTYGKSWQLSQDQWDSLIRSKGDFKTIDIELKESLPVEGFDQHWLGG